MGGSFVKKLFSVMPILCALLLSSCGRTEDNTETSVSVTDLVTKTDSAEKNGTETSENGTVTEASSQTETETGTAAGTSGQETKTDFTASSEASKTTAAISEAPDTVSEKTATTTTVFDTAEKPPETSAPKAEVIIPEVKVPLADGAKVITGENGEVDYGNASEGYISAVYTGSSDAVKLRIKCGNTQYDHDLEPRGKREFFPLMGSGSYTVKMYEHVSGKNYAEILSGDFEATVKSETTTYLYPNKYVTYSGGSECVKKGAEVCAGKNGDVEKIAAIFDWIADNITYDKSLAAKVQRGEVRSYVPDPDSALAAGKGICFDYASLFAAMCRSQSIPTRLVIGYAEPDIYHAWNEVYTEETGWITPELFLKKKGYNIADATFYAGNSDKEKIAGYISDEGNYSAMYRY